MKVFRYTLAIKFGDFKNTREAITLISCICMYVGTFCVYSILCKCGVLFICVRATPNAYRQINEQLHTFFILLTVIWGLNGIILRQQFIMSNFFGFDTGDNFYDKRRLEKPCVRDPRSPSAVDPRKQV